MTNITSDATQKSEVILVMAFTAYRPGAIDAEAQALIRRAFEAIIDELRRIDAIPSQDIDKFVADAKSGADMDQLMIPAVLFANMLPDIDYFAALVGAGLGDEEDSTSLTNLTEHSRFMEAGSALVSLRQQHGDEALDTPEAQALFMQLMEDAPPEFMKVIHDEAQALDLLPEAKYVNAAGETVYSAGQLAEKLGIPQEQVESDLKRLFGDRLPVGTVHLLQ